MKTPAPAVLIFGSRPKWNPDYSGPYEGEFYAAADVAALLKIAEPLQGLPKRKSLAAVFAQHEALLAACVEFVRKCDAGEARSKSSYAQMVAAIAMGEDA